jgi:hypothetical protein
MCIHLCDITRCEAVACSTLYCRPTCLFNGSMHCSDMGTSIMRRLDDHYSCYLTYYVPLLRSSSALNPVHTICIPSMFVEQQISEQSSHSFALHTLAMKLHHSVIRFLLQLCLALVLLASFTEALESNHVYDCLAQWCSPDCLLHRLSSETLHWLYYGEAMVSCDSNLYWLSPTLKV